MSPPAASTSATLTALFTIGVGGYLAVCAAMWAMQERLMFPLAFAGQEAAALASDEVNAARLGARVRSLTTVDGARVLSWHYGLPEGARAGVVLYVGGNAEHVVSSVGLARALAEQGWELFVLVPRGYPGSEGDPSEAAFEQDMRAAWSYLTGTLAVPPANVVLHGRSLGGGIIGTVIDEVRPGAVVFESTFDSIAAVAADTYPVLPVQTLIRNRFDTAVRAQHLECPTLVVHARTDEVVPFARGEALAGALRSPTVVFTSSGSHQQSLLLSNPEAHAAWRALLAGRAAR
jgi:hypothetical protein